MQVLDLVPPIDVLFLGLEIIFYSSVSISSGYQDAKLTLLDGAFVSVLFLLQKVPRV